MLPDESGKGSGSEGGSGAKPPGKPGGNAAVVALRMEDITHWVVERVARMPREHKFAIGDKLVEACLDVTCALVEATYVRDKLTLLAQASRGRVRGRVLARLANRSRLLSHDPARALRARDGRSGTHAGRLDTERPSPVACEVPGARSGLAGKGGESPTG